MCVRHVMPPYILQSLKQVDCSILIASIINKIVILIIIVHDKNHNNLQYHGLLNFRI